MSHYRIQHGIEQELQVVDPVSFELVRNRMQSILGRIRKKFRSNDFTQFTRDGHFSQLEYSIGIIDDLLELENLLERFRDVACECAESAGVALVASGVTPVGCSRSNETFGEHHHVGVQSPREAVEYTNLVRTFIPELIVLSANSPFYNGSRAGCESYRLRCSNHCALPPALEPTAAWEVAWASRGQPCPDRRKWDVTPFVRGGRPTVEVRVFDVTPNPSISLAIASVLQGLLIWLRDNRNPGEWMKIDSAHGWTEALSCNRQAAIEMGVNASFDLRYRPIAPSPVELSGITSLERTVEFLSPSISKIDNPGKHMKRAIEEHCAWLRTPRHAKLSALDYTRQYAVLAR